MRALIFVAALALLSGCGFFGDKTDAEHLALAENYYNQNKLNEAAIELRNALIKNQKNPRARWLLGKISLELGLMADAEKELKKSVDLGVSKDIALPLLARSLLAQGRLQDVQNLVVGEVSPGRDRADLIGSIGFAHLRQGDNEAAESSFKAALQQYPSSNYALIGLAGVHAARGEFDQAYKLIDQVLAADPNNALAYSYKADLERFEGKYQPAIDSYQKAIDLKRANASERLKLAFLLVKTKQFEKARSTLKRLKRQYPDSPLVNYGFGLYHYVQKDFAKAQTDLELAHKGNPDFIQTTYLLGALHLQQKNFGQAIAYLSEFLADQPDYVPALKMMTFLRVQQGDLDVAEELAQRVLAANPNDPEALNQLATIEYKRGNSDEALRLFAKVVEQAPESGRARLRYGGALLTSGKAEAGMRELEAAIDMSPEQQGEAAQIILVTGLLESKKLDMALKAASDFLEKNPESPMAYNLLGLSYKANGDVEKAKDAFEKVRLLVKGDPTACANLAMIALADADYRGARRYYHEILSVNPTHTASMLNLAMLAAREKNKADVKRWLTKAVEASPDAVVPRVLLAREYLQEKNADRALNTLGEILAEQNRDPRVLMVLGEIQMEAHQLVDAESTFLQLIEQHPNLAKGHYYLARVYAIRGDSQGLKRELDKTIELAPELLPPRVVKARLAIRDGRLDAAREEIKKLKALTGEDDAEVLALEGAISLREGSPAIASASYKKLFEMEESTSSLLLLARSQWLQGEQGQAISALENWISVHPDDVPARMELAKAYQGVGNVRAVTAQYQQVLKLDANNIMALNNLAWANRANDPERARTFAEQAYKLAPDSPNVMDTLASILLSEGEVDQAAALVSKALRVSPDDPSFLYRRALILEQQGDVQGAKANLQKALSGNQLFKERIEAQLMLDRIRKDKG